MSLPEHSSNGLTLPAIPAITPRRRWTLLLGAVLPSLLGCAVTPPSEINEAYADIIQQRLTQYQLKPGDMVSITASRIEESELNQIDLRVLPDGRTDLHLLPNYQAAGKTPAQLEEALKQVFTAQQRAISGDVRTQVTPAPEYVYVSGQFERIPPVEIILRPHMTLQQLVTQMNGLKVTGDTDYGLLVRHYPNLLVPDMFRVDLNDRSEDVYLLPGDELVLQRNTLGAIVNYLREFVFGIFPFGGLATTIAAGAL